MILWCSVCQQYQGQTPPYEEYSPTHGLCKECAKKGFALTAAEIDWARKLSRIQADLGKAGAREDREEAIRLIDFAISIGVRPVDVSMGVIGPLLYEIGSQWAAGQITIAQQQKFTKFSQSILDYVSMKVPAAEESAKVPFEKRLKVLLVCAPDNFHTIGARVLHLFFKSLAVDATAAPPGLSAEKIAEMTRAEMPALLGISVALPEQIPGAIRTIQAVRAIPECRSVGIALGGFAMSQGLTPPVPGISICNDIASFRMLQAKLIVANDKKT